MSLLFLLRSCIHLATSRTYFVLHLVSRRTLENLPSVHNTSRLYSLVTKKPPSPPLIPPHARSGAPPSITLRPGPHVAPAKTSCGWDRKSACNIYVRHWPIIAWPRRHIIEITAVLIRRHDFHFRGYFGRFAKQNNAERISKAEFSRPTGIPSKSIQATGSVCSRYPGQVAWAEEGGGRAVRRYWTKAVEATFYRYSHTIFYLFFSKNRKP